MLILRFYENFYKTNLFLKSPPNFLVASDFDNYVTPEVRIHDQSSEAGWDTPPDSRSLADAQLIDVTETTKNEKVRIFFIAFWYHFG